ncbi:hypothetical protein [Streptomyces sp. NPDC001828]|uniref:hypothetical protein n=1 Tax=Streptomyces sp. NPDC001828 TaxID=3364615 RepID=UPI0036BCF7A6
MLITDAAVRETAAILTQSLAGDWTLDPEAPADGAAHLIDGDGRAISFRPTFGGASVQLWITGNAAPPLPDDATLADQAAYDARLPNGHRYNKATTLVTEEEEDPAVIILRTLDDLLPAFDYRPLYVGHRPWVDLFDKALSQVMNEGPSVTGTSLRDCGPEAHTTPHDVGVAPLIDAAAGPLTNEASLTEREPAVTSVLAEEPQPQDVARESEIDGVSIPVAEPPGEGSQPGADTEHEASPAENPGDREAGQPEATTNRRPRKRAPRQRAKAATN